MDKKLEIKILEFDAAMKKYHDIIFYKKLGLIVSSGIVFLQIISLLNLFEAYKSTDIVNFIAIIAAFFFAYMVSDFINGLVHMYMDNNTHYTSWVGPFIASFHLHHKTPQYLSRHPFKIFFYESGTKYWLLIYLFVLVYYQFSANLNFYLNIFLVSIGILSSFAEVSHFWCHNSRNTQKIICALQKYRILLNKKHHSHHHQADNVNYAFLNGMTDPIINKIASCFYQGYQNNSDKHVMAYTGKQSQNR